MANDPCIDNSKTVGLDVENDKLVARVIVSPDPGNGLGERDNGAYAFTASGDPANQSRFDAGKGIYTPNAVLFKSSQQSAGGFGPIATPALAAGNGWASTAYLIMRVGPFSYPAVVDAWGACEEYTNFGAGHAEGVLTGISFGLNSIPGAVNSRGTRIAYANVSIPPPPVFHSANLAAGDYYDVTLTQSILATQNGFTYAPFWGKQTLLVQALRMPGS